MPPRKKIGFGNESDDDSVDLPLGHAQVLVTVPPKECWIKRLINYIGSFKWLGGRKFAGMQEALVLMFFRPDIAPWVAAVYGVYCGINLLDRPTEPDYSYNHSGDPNPYADEG